jgi:prepilin-type N-terminal cleavage/methylation domain-containing protein
MVNNMKEKGFTIIELMVLMAIIGILVAVGMGAYRKNQKTEVKMPLIQNVMPSGETPMEYIENDKRARDARATLRRHSDGSVWACVDNALCYEVK